MNKGDVVQFNENHKWCGSLGIIREKKEIHNNSNNNNLKADSANDIRYMVGVPIPEKGTAYIYVLQSEFAIEYVGFARLVVKEVDE